MVCQTVQLFSAKFFKKIYIFSIQVAWHNNNTIVLALNCVKKLDGIMWQVMVQIKSDNQFARFRVTAMPIGGLMIIVHQEGTADCSRKNGHRKLLNSYKKMDPLKHEDQRPCRCETQKENLNPPLLASAAESQNDAFFRAAAFC